MAGVHEPVGEGAVVGEQDEPLGKKVEPADRVEAQVPVPGRNEVEHGLAPFGIRGRRDHLDRLVEHEVDKLLAGAQRLAVDGDLVARQDALAFGCRQPVHLDAALGNELVGLAPGAHARMGDGLVEAHGAVFSRRGAAPGAPSVPGAPVGDVLTGVFPAPVPDGFAGILGGFPGRHASLRPPRALLAHRGHRVQSSRSLAGSLPGPC